MIRYKYLLICHHRTMCLVDILLILNYKNYLYKNIFIFVQKYVKVKYKIKNLYFL